MTRKSLLLASALALGILDFPAHFQPMSVQAQSQPVTGETVGRIVFTHGADTPDTLLMVAPGQWKQFRGNGTFFADFVEIGRDAWSVYLRDPRRNLNIQADLHRKTLSSRNQQGQEAVIGTIIGATVMTAAAPAPQAPQQTVQVPTQQPQVQQPQVQQHQVQQPAVQTAAPKTPVPGPDDPDFNPFADQEPSNTQAAAPQNTQPASQTGTPATKAPDWVNTAGGTKAGGGAAAPAAPASSPYSGAWVDAYAKYERKGDGLKGPVTWTAPDAVVVSSPDPSTLLVYFEEGRTWKAQKTAENRFAGPGFSIEFTPVGDRFTMQLSAVGFNKTYAMAQTSDGTLSRDRFNETERENRVGGFAQGTFAKEWNVIFHSFQGEEMDLFDPNRGKKRRIFKQPGPRDYTLDDTLGQSLPFGLIGQRIRRSSSEQLETVISNMASFHKSMSYNFGGGAGDPAKAGLALNVSREQSSGSEQSSTSAKAMGLARVERYVFLLDKPNMDLDPVFKNDLQRYVNGQLPASQFIRNYGTHYAVAVHLGGLGKAERTLSSRDIKDFAQESLSISGGGAAKGVSLNGGFSMTQGSSTGSSALFSKDKWDAVGGSGSMGSLGWSVNDDDTVPVRYDLRPLSDLISPLFFKEEWGSPNRSSYVNARRTLESEINRYMAGVPPLPDRLVGPLVYKLTFHSLVCFNNGDEGKAPARLHGVIIAGVTGMDGSESVEILKIPEASPKSVGCNGGEIPIDVSRLVLASRNKWHKDSYFELALSMTELDDGIIDPHDRLQGSGERVSLRKWQAIQPRTDIPGTVITNPPGVNFGPYLSVKVSFQEVQ